MNVENNLFEALALVGKLLGMSRSVSTVFAVLYNMDGPCTVEELAAATHLSKSAVSLALRELIQMGAAQELGIIGERCRRYQGQPNLAETVIDMFTERIQNPLAELRTRLEHAAVEKPRVEQARTLLHTMDRVIATIQE